MHLPWALASRVCSTGEKPLAVTFTVAAPCVHPIALDPAAVLHLDGGVRWQRAARRPQGQIEGCDDLAVLRPVAAVVGAGEGGGGGSTNDQSEPRVSHRKQRMI